MELEKQHRLGQQGDSFWQGVKDCVPTLLGYLSIGFAAGVVGNTSGMSLTEIALMSALLYAGSGQFIAAGMIAASSPISAIIFTIFFINLRHLLLSAAIAPHFQGKSVIQNVLIGSQLTDETFGVAMNQVASGKPLGYRWMLGLNITAYLNWFLATVAGGLLGKWIPHPEKYGLDFALPAMFIGLLVLQMNHSKKFVTQVIVALSSVLIVIGASYLIPGSMGIIMAAVLSATIGVVYEQWKSDGTSS
ncbi:AzlC family ABC transporter permease [Paenibacillus crassostreae]|uniref:Branched-chain amino acid permease n=1 Tax=Paenibacillus crassostreae TaxID=1763538 RepID=A0A167DWB4_9BACL|nr:AzlC family ABC transporter permease [Paenibacillus crassostreae]AOZ90982.1 branched-chain amino acid transporter AzlC [Paenibacillus crassostreae]OAB74855.1 branched-chain amino acid permease [Paenibacillus crassostreae]